MGLLDGAACEKEFGMGKLPISDVKESLQIGKFTIEKPRTWDQNKVKLQIQDYDIDSTEITIEQLKELKVYIDEILNSL